MFTVKIKGSPIFSPSMLRWKILFFSPALALLIFKVIVTICSSPTSPLVTPATLLRV